MNQWQQQQDSWNLKVQAGTLEYCIVMQEKFAGLLTQQIQDWQASRLVIVTDQNVARLYQSQVSSCLPNADWIILQPGEATKNLATMSFLYEQLYMFGVDRKSIVLALGGGMVGDIAGFAAATYLRGIRWIQIPTTLLAMVDASIGGKVAIDLPQGKNLVGAFYQPQAVCIASEFLNTLTPLEWNCGMAEVIKHGLLADPWLLQIKTLQDGTLEMLRRAIQVKANIVQQDPLEHSIRIYLNLGHTFAHAIEQTSHYSIPHGQAVALGLLAQSRLAYQIGLCASELPKTILEILQRWNLPTQLPSLNPEACYQSLCYDKKAQQQKPRFVLLKAICEPIVCSDISQKAVLEVLDELTK